MADRRPPGKKTSFQKIPETRSVRRNLFGRDPDVPLEDLSREREDLSQKQESRFQKKWNFDLSKEKPSKGEYEWSKPIPINSPTSLLQVPRGANGNNSGVSNVCPQSMSSIASPSGSVSSGEFSRSIAGTSSDDMSSPTSSSQMLLETSTKTSLKRHRSSSAELSQDDENRPVPKSPKR